MNDDAVAYGWFLITVFVITSALLSIILTPLCNQMTEQFNDDVADGMISEQTRSAYNYSLGFVRYGILGFSLIGALLYGVTRAIYKKDYGGL